MTGKFFVDTNVLIYCRDASAGLKQKQALDWMKHLWQNRAGCLSTQVLNEFYYAATRKLKPGLPVAAARKDVEDLFSWKPVPMEEKLIAASWGIQDRFEISFWDSLIVAAAQVSDCDFLLTEDLAEGQNYLGVVVVNPFHQTPNEK
jgi:predicted nucleic acid-binding protein